MTWYWILTVSWVKFPGSATTQTLEGTVDGTRVFTRAAAFKAALALARKSFGIAEGEAVSTLFWSLDPELLTAGTCGDRGSVR